MMMNRPNLAGAMNPAMLPRIPPQAAAQMRPGAPGMGGDYLAQMRALQGAQGGMQQAVPRGMPTGGMRPGAPGMGGDYLAQMRALQGAQGGMQQAVPRGMPTGGMQPSLSNVLSQMNPQMLQQIRQMQMMRG